MLDAFTGAICIQYNGYNIEAYGQIDGVHAYIVMCRLGKQTPLARIHCFFRRKEETFGTGLYFHYNQFSGSGCHYIQLSPAGLPVESLYPITLLPEMLQGYLFAVMSAIIVVSHWYCRGLPFRSG